jgi:hypothetical protein
MQISLPAEGGGEETQPLHCLSMRKKYKEELPLRNKVLKGSLID